MTVKCFSVHTTIDYPSGSEKRHARFQRSKEVRKHIRAMLQDPDVNSVLVHISREERDPVENSAS